MAPRNRPALEKNMRKSLKFTCEVKPESWEDTEDSLMGLFDCLAFKLTLLFWLKWCDGDPLDDPAELIEHIELFRDPEKEQKNIV